MYFCRPKKKLGQKIQQEFKPQEQEPIEQPQSQPIQDTKKSSLCQISHPKAPHTYAITLKSKEKRPFPWPFPCLFVTLCRIYMRASADTSARNITLRYILDTHHAILHRPFRTAKQS